ncbi:MAG: hypothetical protein PHE79_06145 [Eubacteriales bacterium]|nr:hypothetical protein [Eubacteriales bacterium]
MAFFSVLDPFAAKSINTINALAVLVLNQRIHHLTPGRNYIDDNDFIKNNEYENEV